MKLLEEEIKELEALEEVHEQLVESNHELEMDLREELDMAEAAKREVRIPFYYSPCVLLRKKLILISLNVSDAT